MYFQCKPETVQEYYPARPEIILAITTKPWIIVTRKGTPALFPGTITSKWHFCHLPCDACIRIIVQAVPDYQNVSGVVCI